MKKKKAKHHILPSSRGGTLDKENLALITKKEHEFYHALFSNLTPDEIILYLLDHFWNGQKGWLTLALTKLTVRGAK